VRAWVRVRVRFVRVRVRVVACAPAVCCVCVLPHDARPAPILCSGRVYVLYYFLFSILVNIIWLQVSGKSHLVSCGRPAGPPLRRPIETHRAPRALARALRWGQSVYHWDPLAWNGCFVLGPF
jgi:hypothetical protein